MSETHDRNEEICPNCLDPIPAGVEICPSCGMNLNEAADAVPAEPVEGMIMAQPSENAGSAPNETKAETPKDSGKKPTMMQSLVRGMGVYLIYSALTNGYRVLSNPEALRLERGSREHTLGIVSNLVYLAAGLLAVWPWIQEALAKRRAGSASETTIDGEASENLSDGENPAFETTVDAETIGDEPRTEAMTSDDLAELRAEADAALSEGSESAE